MEIGHQMLSHHIEEFGGFLQCCQGDELQSENTYGINYFLSCKNTYLIQSNSVKPIKLISVVLKIYFYDTILFQRSNGPK